MNQNTMLQFFLFLFGLLISVSANSLSISMCSVSDAITYNDLTNFTRLIIPDMCGKHKGDIGKLAVIGGSAEYTGAPYFSAMAAFRVGADLVYVITTNDAAPIIKSYSPDLIVIPNPSTEELRSILQKVHAVVIGPGLGRKQETLKFFYNVIDMCRTLKKPLVIDADGLYGIFKNITTIKNYPSPGVILTPNHVEAQRLKGAVPTNNVTWYGYWGKFVSILEKGSEDPLTSY